MKIELQWKTIPMGSMNDYLDWHCPSQNQGVYMMVLATQSGGYKGFYIGRSTNIGNRMIGQLRSWFLDPDECFYIPVNAAEFIQDPVHVINDENLQQGLDDRCEIMREILKHTWFCFAFISELQLEPGVTIEHIEHILQEGLKQHSGINVNGYIGDSQNISRPDNNRNIKVFNSFGRRFWYDTLPCWIRFDDTLPWCVRFDNGNVTIR